MPSHPIVHHFGMTKERFKFIWCHFHTSYTKDFKNNIETETECEDTIEEEVVGTVGFEQIQQEQHHNEYENEEPKLC